MKSKHNRYSSSNNLNLLLNDPSKTMSDQDSFDTSDQLNKIVKEVENRVSYKFNMSEFISYYMGRMCKKCRTPQHERIHKLRMEGYKRLDEAFDIVQFVKNQREIKILRDIVYSQSQKMLLPYLKTWVLNLPE